MAFRSGRHFLQLPGPTNVPERGPCTWSAFVLALAGALAAAACAGEGAHVDSDDWGPVTISLAHVGAPGSLYELTANEFARRVHEQFGDRVTVLVFGSSQLGGDETLLQKLKLGTLDIALPSTVMSSAVDAFGLFEMPYLISNRSHMRRVEEEIVWPILAPLAEERGYKIIAVWENGFRHVTNNVRPIRTPADLADIKLRTPRGLWRVKLFQAYGANPSPLAFSELFVALQTGVMDGQENPLAQIYASKLQEVQTYLSLTGHVYTPAFVTVGASWARLPEVLREALIDTARGVQAFAHQEAERMDVELLEALRAAGVQVNEPDHQSFIDASQGIYSEFGSSVEGGREMIERVLALADGS